MYKIVNTPKILYGLIVIVGLIYFLSGCKRQSRNINDNQNDADLRQVNAQVIRDNTYAGLRQKAFDMTSEQLGLKDLKADDIYGVIMDCGISDGIVTLVTYKTGDASVYYDIGIVKNGEKNETISNASKHFVEIAENYFNMAKKTETIFDPDTNYVRFYFLTIGGIYYVQEQMINLENYTSQWEEFTKEAFKVADNIILSGL